MNPVLFVVGPTGTGKSRLAFELAQQRQLPIVNGDSIQIYQRVNIGSAKPSFAERQFLPHFLFDLIPPPEEITAGDYRRRALQILAHLIGSSPVIVVGGSGFYIQALQKGMYDLGVVPESIKNSLQDEKESRGLSELYNELRACDPEFAQKVGATDSYRILRGLSVMRSQGKTITSIQNEFQNHGGTAFPYPFLTLALNMNRQNLKERLLIRTQEMLRRGLIEEVEVLLSEQLQNWAPMKSVGYIETQKYLVGEIKGRDELVEAITSSSMKLAKRQATWFRRDLETRWFDAETEWHQAIKFGNDFLNGTSS